jgi:hypothetical protein
MSFDFHGEILMKNNVEIELIEISEDIDKIANME